MTLGGRGAESLTAQVADADGNLYLAVGSIVTGSEGPPGQLLRCESIAGA